MSDSQSPTRLRSSAETISERTARLAPGAVLAGRYRIVELLGVGGMGEVFRAEDLSLGQTVALKFLPARLARDPGALERVREEVRVARRVSHPNVCRVHDLGEAEAQQFISMEYVDGEDLASLLKRVGRLAGDRALEIARELCAGIAAAHASGVIHRDLKPANVMIDRRGRARITDFGLARLGEDRTAAGEIAGTPAYMAPEQLAGIGASVRSDLYALGLVLYELFTGHRVSARRETPVVPPRELVPELDPAVERAILSCLMVRPAERPESALAVLAELSGGDRLKAALAAGQTPSPSAVAAAPVRGALSPLAAWACLIIALVVLVVSVDRVGRLGILGRVQPPIPPAALAVKAEEAMRALAGGVACADDASGFDYDSAAVRVAGAGASTLPQSAEAAAERRMIVFWHRCSPIPLLPRGIGARVTRDDPPLGVGEAQAVLDVDGRLLSFQGPTGGGEAGRRIAEPLGTFFQLAGLGTPPAPRVPADGGSTVFDIQLDGGVSASVETRLGPNGLAEARVIPPWAPRGTPQAVQFFGVADVFRLFTVSLLLTSLPLARHNLRAGRGDRDGALRLGGVVFGCEVVAIVAGAHHAGSLAGEIGILTQAVAWGLYHGVTTVLLYVALEPFVRRVSPERLVSWTRLLAGDVRDPMVARDVLVGVGIAFATLGLALLPLTLLARPPLLPVETDLEPLLGLELVGAAIAGAVVFVVRSGLCLFLLLQLAVRAFGRIRGLAPAAFFAIAFGLTLANMGAMGISEPLAVLIAATSGAAWAFLITRFGVLAMIANLLVRALAATLPGTSSLAGWTAPGMWCFVGITALLGVYGLYYSTGGRPFGDWKPLQL
jgi:serine/threonine-protein kinase